MATQNHSVPNKHDTKTHQRQDQGETNKVEASKAGAKQHPGQNKEKYHGENVAPKADENHCDQSETCSVPENRDRNEANQGDVQEDTRSNSAPYNKTYGDSGKES